MTRRMRQVLLIISMAVSLHAAQSALDRAEDLYQRTDYTASLEALSGLSSPTAAEYCLIGRDYMMLGDFKKATEALERASGMEPGNSNYALWLGRAWGRRAETSSPFTAPMSAAKARDAFERAVQLDPKNLEALSDLFDYYLQAPGFLGGGEDKAANLAARMAAINPAEYQFSQAQLAERRKEYNSAEEHFRRAVELAPRHVGRFIELARYLAKRGQNQESEAVWAQAEKVAPGNARVMFWRAKTYVQQNRNLDQAQELLKRYLRCELTPDDPPREEAERLLKKAIGA